MAIVEVSGASTAAVLLRKPHWYQFSLRRLIVWFTLLGIGFGWLGNELLCARRQQVIVQRIQRLNGDFRYDYDPVTQDGTTPRDRVRGRWINRLVGPDLFAHVAGVYFSDNTSLQNSDLVFLAELPRLQAVELYGPGITDEGLQNLRGAHRLRGLHLVETLCTTEAVSRLPAAPTLEYFTVSGSAANDINMPPLRSLPNLRSLNLCSFSPLKGYLRAVTDEGLSHIAQLQKLETLFVNGADITDDGLRHLHGLNRLTALCLDAPQVSDAGMEHLGALTQLKFLNLHGTVVSDAGVAKLESLKSLEFLGLDNTPITDIAAGTIAQLPSLHTLHIARTAVTDDGLRNLQAATKLGRLTVASSVTEEGLASLSKALPLCSIRGSDGTTEFNFP